MTKNNLLRNSKSVQEALRLDPNAKEASEGINRTMMAKYASRNDPEAVKQRAMNDPEVAQIMGDPTMRMILEQVIILIIKKIIIYFLLLKIINIIKKLI